MKLFPFIILILLLPYISSCSSDAKANSSTDKAVLYESSRGHQEDILLQQTTIIDGDSAYNDFLLTIPSMSRDAPVIDFHDNTVISIITNSLSKILS